MLRRWLTGADSGVGQVDKQALESCLGVCALALSVVMAGTGDLETLKILRGVSRQAPELWRCHLPILCPFELPWDKKADCLHASVCRGPPRSIGMHHIGGKTSLRASFALRSIAAAAATCKADGFCSQRPCGGRRLIARAPCRGEHPWQRKEACHGSCTALLASPEVPALCMVPRQHCAHTASCMLRAAHAHHFWTLS